MLAAKVYDDSMNADIHALVAAFEEHRDRLLAEGKRGFRAVMTPEGLLGVWPTLTEALARVHGRAEGTFAIIEVAPKRAPARLSQLQSD